jgi:hypothetical protein
MNTVLTVLGCFVLGVFALTAFGMTISKKDMEDFDTLSAFVDDCERTEENRELCLEEFYRLAERGHIPQEKIEDMRRRIIYKFR